MIPSILERKLLPKVWGGTALHDVLGMTLPPGEAIGEAWELFDRPDGSSGLRGRGATLRDWMLEDPTALLGRVRPAPGGWFPLLLKFIDANESLSVQVHPGEDQAREHGDGAKDEAWLVLNAGPEARIVHGFESGVTKEAVASAADSPEIEPLLRTFRPVVGDVVHVPPGTVHALGPEVVVFEVQQNSDLTYRLWDWGRPRELHLAAGLEALQFDPGCAAAATTPMEVIDENSEWLIRSAHFRVRRIRVPQPGSLGTEGSFKILTVLKGYATLGWRSEDATDEPLSLRPGDTALVPACTDAVFLSPVGEFEALWIDGDSD